MFEEEKAPVNDAEQKQEDALNARIQEELKKARAEWEKEAESRIAEARAEAEKLARMTGEERAHLAAEEKEKKLAEREKQLFAREMRQEALERMEEKRIPKALSDALSYESREAMEKGLEVLEKVFFSAVEEGVVERMRGAAPSAGRKIKNAGDMSDNEYYESRFGMGR